MLHLARLVQCFSFRIPTGGVLEAPLVRYRLYMQEQVGIVLHIPRNDLWFEGLRPRREQRVICFGLAGNRKTQAGDRDCKENFICVLHMFFFLGGFDRLCSFHP